MLTCCQMWGAIEGGPRRKGLVPGGSLIKPGNGLMEHGSGTGGKKAKIIKKQEKNKRVGKLPAIGAGKNGVMQRGPGVYSAKADKEMRNRFGGRRRH